ncbi:MAG: hypothetical protein C5B52_18515 [Bacteroidetes bacterium]|nr:MAG: hypothetical protein C5B52_18515 [Bacteroidota bacterium]
METIQEQVRRVNEKLQQLLKEYASLRRENEKLKADLQAQKEIEDISKEKLELLQQQIAIVKASSGKSDEASKKEFEKRINHYIREIDRCIAVLGSN